MRIWSYGVNSYYKKASYILEEANWCIFFIQNLIMFTCSIIPPIPIPFGSKIKFYDKYFNQQFTAKEYYGNLSHIFHCCVCMKIFSWFDKRKKYIFVPADYNEVRKELIFKEPELFEFEGESEYGD
ncbi:MAG: hypothetical protein ACOC1K_01850 [Nanoarchaeota archaeon]